jgi:outer membrane receptor protein involved in Fe transport
VEQYSFGRYSGRPQNYKAGIDYFASKKTTLGFVLTGGVEDDKFRAASTAQIFNSKHEFVQYNDALSQTHNPWTNIGFNVNFDIKLDTAGKELTADADRIQYRTRGHQFSNNYLFGSNNIPSEDPYLLNGYLPADIDIYSFKADYKQPLKKNTNLEAGVKSSYVKTDNDAQYTIFDNPLQKWVVDTARSNRFVYKENINAAYINLQKQLKKWGVQVGLRVEQTIADGNQVTKLISFRKNYTKLFPTTYISYKLNDSNTLGLSYGRRIERPGYQALNPFQFQLDRYTYQQGNPNLQPQFSHNIELSYNYKGQLNLSANYTTISDIINDVLITQKQPGDSNYTTFLTTQNIASSRNIGFSVNYNKQLKKWWTFNVFANVYNNHYKGVIDYEPIDVQFTSFSANTSSQFKFNKGWSAEISGWFNSQQLVSSAILARPMGMFSLGGGKQVLKDKGTIRLNLRDPFYLLNFTGTSDLAKGYTKVRAYWDNRRVIVTFNYRFGKTLQQERKRSSASDEEKNRIRTGGQQ